MVVVVIRLLANKSLDTHLLQARKTNGELTISAPTAMLPCHQCHTNLNTANQQTGILQDRNQTDTLQVREAILHKTHIGNRPLEATSKTMAEVDRNIWLSASQHRAKEQQLHAGIAGDER